MNIVGQRVCRTCKHFRSDLPNPECHLNPPHTTPVLIGVDPKKGPLIHHIVSYDLTQPHFDCGQWAPKIEIQN